MNLQAISEALMDAVADQGLHPYNTIPTSPEFPAVYVGWPSELTDFASTGSCSMRVALVVCVSLADITTAQNQLSDILSSALVVAVMQAPRVHWSDIAFTSVSNFRETVFGESQCLAGDINLSLRTT